jgi:hypothetical protein
MVQDILQSLQDSRPFETINRGNSFVGGVYWIKYT